MKKGIAFLWLIVSMLATLFPCCTQDDCGADTACQQQRPKKTRKSEGACSPFITCGTCAGFTQTAKKIELPSIISQKVVHQSRTFLIRLTNYHSTPFQPPRTV